MRKFSNNDVFSEWTIICAYHKKTKFNSWKHLCRCACGEIRSVAGVHLRTGASKGCGCSARKEFSERLKTHGYTGTRTYKCWKGIKKRCFNEKDQAYPRYGGAGISMCSSWKDSFESFLSDMGECPDGLTIDRIEGTKGYYKGNCRWASYTTQARNRKQYTDMPTGVSVLPSGRFRATICTNYKSRHIGCFSTIDQAVTARKEAELSDWGK